MLEQLRRSRLHRRLRSRLAGATGWGGLARDAASGVVSSLVTVAYCISFSALVFQGSLASGIGLGLATLLVGSAVAGFVVSLTTELAPADAGPDTPAVAVLSVLSASVAADVLGHGGGTASAIQHVLVAISLSTLLTGLMLVALGTFRLGELLRFIPFPVVGGFLAASGWQLVTGAVAVMTGIDPMGPDWMRLAGAGAVPQLVVGFGFAVAMLAARRRADSFVLLPLALLLTAVAANLAAAVAGPEWRAAWFLPSGAGARIWWPLPAVLSGEIDWLVYVRSSVEIAAVCGVTAIALLLDVSSLEVARARSADIDGELRGNGLANVVSASLGGAAGNLSLQSSVLIEEAGGVTRRAGVFAALTTAALLLLQVDVLSLMPRALLGGLLAYLGIVLLIQALFRAPALRSWSDLALTGAILAAIVAFGYLVGVMLGIVGACLTFAVNYSRIGVVRRALTRADFASTVERSPDQAELLQRTGAKIQIFWLSGFIFFGSSNRLFEQVRRRIDEQKEPPVRFVVLDFAAVPGADSSAILSLIKLRNHCDQHGVALALCGLGTAMQATLERNRLCPMESRHRTFPTRNEALEWCEDGLLAEVASAAAPPAELATWLARELGEVSGQARLERWFERRDVPAGHVLYDQGAPSDRIDLVVSGRIAIVVRGEDGRPLRLRSMVARTVVGEMGFFRGRARTASVIAETEASVYILTRDSLAAMQREEPALAARFLEFVIRTLSDRVELANREIAALI